MAVIGTDVAVLVNGAAELRHREHHHVAHLLSQVGGEGGERVAQILEPGGELALTRALVDVRVPAGAVEEGDLHADVRLDELSDLQEAPSQAAARVVGSVRGLVLRRIRLLQLLHRVEPLLRRRGEESGRRALVQRLERAGEAIARRLLWDPQSERLEVVDGEGRGRAREDARQLRPESDGAERRVGVFLVVPAVAVEPSVGGGLQPRRAGLHVVLRVEVAAGRVGRAHGVHGGERFVVPQRLQRRERGVEAEVAIQIHDLPARHGDAGPLPVIQLLAVRHDHVEPVHGAALEQTNKRRTVGRSDGRTDCRVGRATQE